MLNKIKTFMTIVLGSILTVLISLFTTILWAYGCMLAFSTTITGPREMSDVDIWFTVVSTVMWFGLSIYFGKTLIEIEIEEY